MFKSLSGVKMSGQVVGFPPVWSCLPLRAQLILPASCLAVFIIQTQIQRQWQGQIQRQWQRQTQRHPIWSIWGHSWYFPPAVCSCLSSNDCQCQGSCRNIKTLFWACNCSVLDHLHFYFILPKKMSPILREVRPVFNIYSRVFFWL